MAQLGRNLKTSDFTRIPLILFKLVGIGLLDPDGPKPIIERICFFIGLVLIGSSSLSMVLFSFLEEFSSPIEITAFATYVGYIINSSCKAMAVWNGRFTLREIFSEMEKIFPKTQKDVSLYRLEEYYIQLRVRVKSLMIFHVWTTTMFDLFPIVQSTFEYFIYGGSFMFRFPYILYYPFDATQPLVYPFVCLYQSMAAYALSCLFLGSDLLLVSIVHMICMHFEYLANRIESFKPTGSEEDVDKINDFVKYHINILSLSYKINEVFNFAILMNYIASGGVICMIGLQLTMGSEILDLLKFFAFLISALVHVYFICYFGTNLIETSSKIAYAAFSHQWYLGNPRYRKMLVLIIARSQQNPAILTAFKFFTVSMESLKELLTTSYQFFTLIKTRYDEAH